MGFGALYGMGLNYGVGGGYQPRPAKNDPVPPQGGTGAVRTKAAQVKPIPVLLFCPRCRGQHVDRDEWATRSHQKHLCEHCKHVWRAAIVPTVGVETIPEP